MDARRRIAEPVADGAGRPGAGAAPASGRFAAWLPFGGRFRRTARRLAGPIGRRRVPRGTGAVAFFLLMAATFTGGVVRGGHVEAVLAELSDARDAIANAFGFRITSIALAGGRALTREEILTTAGVTGRSSLLFLDATAARARLKANPWIAEATILKLYPGRLHIKVTERDAFALWQKDGKVAVISADGTVCREIRLAAFRQAADGGRRRRRDQSQGFSRHRRRLPGDPRPGAGLDPGRQPALESQAEERHPRPSAGGGHRDRADHADRARPR